MRRFLVILLATVLLVGIAGRVRAQAPPAQEEPVVRILYFYQEGCSNCEAVEEEILAPLQEQYGERLDIRWLEVDAQEYPEHYELLVRIEESFDVPAGERGYPTLVIGSQVLVGQEEIRQNLQCLVDSCAASGTGWPDVEGLEAVLQETQEGPDEPSTDPMAPFIPELGEGEEPCEEAAPVCREEAPPLRAAYFYQTGCSECNRVETDIEYVEQQYPQLVIDRFNIYDELPLAKWMAQQAGYDPNDIHTPAFFIGEDVLVGEEEITPHNLRALMEAYAPAGAEAYWVGVDPDETDIPSILKVTFAGLVDGLNPCAFATLIFFISYLTASQRRGREILIAGAAFTLGVFLAYVAVGMGLYRFLDYLQEEVSFMQQVGRWVYGLTALMCAVLAVLSFLDYLKARRGEVEDMNLSLPESLRKRTRSAIRSGQKARTFVVATFFTGLVVSLLELACTGQLYLPTIIYMVSEPGMRAQGTLYLLLYNLMFILPLVVVFVLAYFGLTTYQLGLFFKRHMATVKLLTAVVFVSLAVWLGTALISG